MIVGDRWKPILALFSEMINISAETRSESTDGCKEIEKKVCQKRVFKVVKQTEKYSWKPFIRALSTNQKREQAELIFAAEKSLCKSFYAAKKHKFHMSASPQSQSSSMASVWRQRIHPVMKHLQREGVSDCLLSWNGALVCTYFQWMSKHVQYVYQRAAAALARTLLQKEASKLFSYFLQKKMPVCPSETKCLRNLQNPKTPQSHDGTKESRNCWEHWRTISIKYFSVFYLSVCGRNREAG